MTRVPFIRRFFVDGATGAMSVITLVFMFAWMSRKNAGYPVGGSKAVIDLLVERLRALGGTLRLMAKVDEILVEKDAAVGVKLADGNTVRADWVVSAADGHASIYELLRGKYRDEAIDQFYETQQVFPSYLQVSLGIAQDLSSEPGFLCRCVTMPLRLDPDTVLDQVSFRIFHYDPTFAPPGKTAVTSFLPTYNYAYWLNAAIRGAMPRRSSASPKRSLPFWSGACRDCASALKSATYRHPQASFASRATGRAAWKAFCRRPERASAQCAKPSQALDASG